MFAKIRRIGNVTAIAMAGEAADFVKDAIGHMRCSEEKSVSVEQMKMINLVAVGFVIGWLGVAQAQVWADPHTRKDGTYVGGHYRTNPDGNPTTTGLIRGM